MQISALITKVIMVIVLASVAAGVATPLYDAVNVSYGPFGAVLMVLLAELALGAVILFSLVDIVRSAVGNTGKL